jgi:hypothetical protein
VIGYSTLPMGRAASSADSALVLTLAGVESTGVDAPAPCPEVVSFCHVPRRWPASWPAGERRFASSCLTHLPDGTIILCQGDQLLALAADGRIRRWSPPLDGVGVEDIVDADAAGDGSVIVLGYSAVARVRPDGTAAAVMSSDQQRSGDETIVATSDGGALIAESTGAVVRVSAEGGVSVVVPRLPVDPRRRHEVPQALDIAALPDGSFALAQNWQERVLRLTSDGRVTVLAGGGRGFVNGALATSVRLGAVRALAATGDGGLYLATDQGLLRLTADGRITRVAPGAPSEEGLSESAQSLATAGRSAASARLAVERLDVLPDAIPTVLARNFVGGGTRVAALSGLGVVPRFAAALTARDRLTLRKGSADVLATGPATARIDILDRGRVIKSVTATLRAGHNQIAIPRQGSRGGLVARVTATTREGQVAVHALSFLPSSVLTATEAQRLRSVAQGWGGPGGDVLHSVSHCQRRTSRSFACDWEASAECCAWSGRALLRLRADGLTEFTEFDHGRVFFRALLEPR